MASSRGHVPQDVQKTTKDKYLLTRKTWRYMFDSGRKVLPQGLSGFSPEEIEEIERQFQKACENESEFIPAEEILARAKATFKARRCMSEEELKLQASAPVLRETLTPDAEANAAHVEANQNKNRLTARAGSRIITSPGGSNAPEYFVPAPTGPVVPGSRVPTGPLHAWTSEFAGPQANHGSTVAAGDVATTGVAVGGPGQYMATGSGAAAGPVTGGQYVQIGSAGGTGGQQYVQFGVPGAAPSGRRLSAQQPGRNDREAFLLGSRAYGILPQAAEEGNLQLPYLQHVDVGSDPSKATAGLLIRSDLRSAFFNPPAASMGPQNVAEGLLQEKLRGLDRVGPSPGPGSTATDHSGFSSSGVSTAGRSTDRPPSVVKVSVSIQADLAPAGDPNDDGSKDSELPSDRMAHHDGSKRSSADSGLSESTLETIRRYLKLVRRNSKSEKEKKDRFKKVNYDKSLRDIKAKGDMSVTVDDDFNKGCQVQEPFKLDKFMCEIVPRKIRLPSETTASSDRSSDGKASLPTSPRYSISASNEDQANIHHQGYQHGGSVRQYPHHAVDSGRQHWQGNRHGHGNGVHTGHVDEFGRRSTTDTGHHSQWSSNRSSVEIDVCDDDVFQHGGHGGGSSTLSSPMSPLSPSGGCPTATPPSRMGTPPHFFSPPPGSPVMTGSVRIQSVGGGQFSWSALVGGSYQQPQQLSQLAHQHGYSPTVQQGTPSRSFSRSAMALIFGSGGHASEPAQSGSAPGNPSPLDSANWDPQSLLLAGMHPHHDWAGGSAGTSASGSSSTLGREPNREDYRKLVGHYPSARPARFSSADISNAAAAAASTRAGTRGSQPASADCAAVASAGGAPVGFFHNLLHFGSTSNILSSAASTVLGHLGGSGNVDHAEPYATIGADGLCKSLLAQNVVQKKKSGLERTSSDHFLLEAVMFQVSRPLEASCRSTSNGPPYT